MKSLVVLAAFIALSLASRVELDEDWEDFKQKYGKSYDSAHDESHRRGIFEDHHIKIQKHNELWMSGEKTYALGINLYSDWSHDEFKAMMNGYKMKPVGDYGEMIHVATNEILDPKVDWRDSGCVTPVKNQAQCGSCWAFSTTGSLEGQHCLATKQKVSLSEQNLVDCDDSDNGCEGGLMDNAFGFIKREGGIDTEASYPYTGEDGKKCLYKKGVRGAGVTGYKDIPSKNEKALQHAIAKIGPISVAIDASNPSFQHYKNGTYYEPDCDEDSLDHGVLAVGYDVLDGGDEVYIVKNSWTSSWGVDGYIYMSRNHDNNCGIATQASYPLV